jgi:tripartite-type tricarboxylate transporter receptor subunit TctC
VKLLVTILGVIALSLPAGAQEPPFPTKGNIELTVLFPVGSSADLTARLLAEGMSRHLPGNVIVVNRPGAGGAIGYKHVATQKPDGYALVWNSNSISTTYYSGQLAFDYRAFDPVARVLVESPVLAVRADAPWKTLAEFLADARARPGRVTVGNSGIGSHTHISSAALFKAAGVEVVEVPYGAAQVVPNLIGGHIDAVVQLPGALSSHLRAGTVRLLAALIPQRDPSLPDVPTAREQGVNVSVEAWRGIAAPRGTPAPVVTALEAAIRKTAEAPEFARACEELGIRPAYMPAAAFGALIAKVDAELSTLMQQIGLKKQP